MDGSFDLFPDGGDRLTQVAGELHLKPISWVGLGN